jgi:predicted RNase H-like nuclease (RuvC/YqgF family)
MKAKIAVATVSGKAYYKLVNELKGRQMPFLSLTPGDPIPPSIKVIITTGKERHLIMHMNVLVFDEETNPKKIVNEGLRLVEGKKSYEKIVFGVDPGKTFGLAVLGDGNILETVTCSNLEETVNTIMKVLKGTPATTDLVKIGNGAPPYTQQLLKLLDETLPKETAIEVVSEAGTSHFEKEDIHKRVGKDVMSAIKIAERRGTIFRRKRKQ